MEASLAQRLHATTHPLHSFIYFAPEAFEAYAALGHQHMKGYFVGRSAAMGAVSAEMVTATFFNFCPDRVADGMPDDWDAGAAAAVQEARFGAAHDVLHRDVSDVLNPAEVDEAIWLAQAIVNRVGYEGKPLAAANAALALPDDPLTRLWQLVTVIREWRGDAHVAVLGAAPLSAVDALLLHAATGQFPITALKATRGWPEEDWRAGTARLVARGLLTEDGAFTDAGREFRDQIERQTDVASMPLVEAIGEDNTRRLNELLRPLRDGLFGADAFKAMFG